MAKTPLCTSQYSVNAQYGSGSAVAIRCKCWSCAECAKRNRARVIGLARRAKPRALLTLTVRSTDYETPDEAALALKRGLRLLRLRLKRHDKLTNFQFLAVFEKHKSGFPHMHLLIRGKFIPWQELRRMWEKITGSYQVDIRRIKSEGQAALYCAKYIGKDLAAFSGCKRWWRSHSYSEEDIADWQEEKAEGQWSRLSGNFHAFRTALLAMGFTVAEPERDRIVYTYSGESSQPPPLQEVARLAGSIGASWQRHY